jgi:hypothetical protein
MEISTNFIKKHIKFKGNDEMPNKILLHIQILSYYSSEGHSLYNA